MEETFTEKQALSTGEKKTIDRKQINWTNERVEKIFSGLPTWLAQVPRGPPSPQRAPPAPYLPHSWVKDSLHHQSTLGEPGPHVRMAPSLSFSTYKFRAITLSLKFRRTGGTNRTIRGKSTFNSE